MPKSLASFVISPRRIILSIGFRNILEGVAQRIHTDSTLRIIDFSLAEPVADSEVAAVEKSLGFALDKRFLAYFRECNGGQLSWLSWEGDEPRDQLVAEYEVMREAGLNMGFDPGVELAGSFNLPGLGELFGKGPQNVFMPEEGAGRTLPLFGGIDEQELRQSLRWIDQEYLLPEDDTQTYYMVGLLAHPRFPDPVCIFADDNAAALADCSPMRARSYLDLMAASAGGVCTRHFFRRNHGAEGDHPLTEFPSGWFSEVAFLLEGYEDRLSSLVNMS